MATVSLLTKSAITKGRDEVYVMAVPLRATKGPAQLLMSTAYSLNLWDLHHFMVLIKPSSPPPPSQVLLSSPIPTWVFFFFLTNFLSVKVVKIMNFSWLSGPFIYQLQLFYFTLFCDGL